jgi:ABC-type nitrate/sulfonate/bicarbonate transport system substrate-binding protein
MSAARRRLVPGRLVPALAAAGLLVITTQGLASAQAAGDAPAMRIAFPSGMNGQIVVTMDKAKIAQKHGLKAEFMSFQYGPPMMEGLAAGSIDAVVTSLMPVTSYAAKIPGDVRIVAMVGQSSHSLMVGKDSPVAGSAELAGKKLGVSFGSDSHLDTLVWLKANGLAGKISLVNIAPAELATALANRSVDAIVIRQPQVLRLAEQAGARILQSWPFHFVAIVKSKFMKAHPAAVEEFLAALQDAMFFIAQNPEQSAAWFAEYLRTDPALIRRASKDDPNYEAGSIAQINLAVTPADRVMIEKWAADAYTERMIKAKVDLGALLP